MMCKLTGEHEPVVLAGKGEFRGLSLTVCRHCNRELGKDGEPSPQAAAHHRAFERGGYEAVRRAQG